MDIKFKDAVKIFEKYNIGKPKELNRLKKGVANKLYKVVTDKGIFTLKIAIRNTKDNRVQYEVDLLNHVQDLPVPKPIKALNGDYLIEYESCKCFVYEFLPGGPPNEVTDKMIIQSAKALAGFHEQIINFKPKPIKRIRLWDTHSFYNLDDLATSIERVENAEIKEGAKYALEQIPAYIADYSELPAGCMHGDFKPDNLLFENEQLTGIVDFDNSYVYNLAFEVGYGIAWFSLVDKNFIIERSALFLKAYEGIRKLSDNERNSLYSQIQYLYLIMIIVNSHWLFDENYPVPEKFSLWNVREFIPAYKSLKSQEVEFNSMVNNI